MRLYVSGSITGIENHWERFDAAVALLATAGIDGVSPQTVPKCKDMSCLLTIRPGDKVPNGHTWECSLRHDLIVMLACDGVVTLPYWETSRGATLEVNTAKAVGLHVRHFYHEDGIPAPKPSTTQGEETA